MTFIDTIAYAAVGLNIVGYSMRRMIPLRIAAIATNVLFIVYSVMAGIHPTLYLHAILLPLERLSLARDAPAGWGCGTGGQGESFVHWLKPSLIRGLQNGDVVFRKGDDAKEMAFIVRGEFRLSELNIVLRSGALIRRARFVVELTIAERKR